MHAPIEDVEVRDEADQPGTAPWKRVEDANLDVDVIVQAPEPGIDWLRQGIVHQQPDPRAPVRGLDELERNQVSAQVVADQVALDVDTALGLVDETQAQA